MGMAIKLKIYATLDLANQSRRMSPKEGRPLRVHRPVLRCPLSRTAEAEGVRLLVPRCHLRPVPSGCRRLLSRSSLQSQSAGRLCLLRKAVHHQTREGVRKGAQMPLIPRSTSRAVSRSSPSAIVRHAAILGKLTYFVIYFVTL